MALFERRKDARQSAGTSAATPPEPPTAAEPGAAPSAAPGPPPVASEVKEQRIRDEPKAPPAAPVTQIHTVATGESLADLASRYGVPAEEIGRQNHVPSPGQVHAGQVLVIRS